MNFGGEGSVCMHTKLCNVCVIDMHIQFFSMHYFNCFVCVCTRAHTHAVYVEWLQKISEVGCRDDTVPKKKKTLLGGLRA